MVVFPAPFGPRKPRISPSLDAEADIVDGGNAAVPLGEVLDLDHRSLQQRNVRGTTLRDAAGMLAIAWSTVWR